MIYVYVEIFITRYYVEVHEGPWYIFSFVLQEVVCLTAAVVVVGMETVGPFLIMMACGYLRAIYDRLSSLGNATDDYTIDVENRLDITVNENHKDLSSEKVLACVIFHQKIME